MAPGLGRSEIRTGSIVTLFPTVSYGCLFGRASRSASSIHGGDEIGCTGPLRSVPYLGFARSSARPNCRLGKNLAPQCAVSEQRASRGQCRSRELPATFGSVVPRESTAFAHQSDRSSGSANLHWNPRFIGTHGNRNGRYQPRDESLASGVPRRGVYTIFIRLFFRDAPDRDLVPVC